ncbi:MAG: alpha/beta hydrolase [Thiomicrospira sp.]|uniref:alpha/beta fold hydrolase n=1 Tax=Thiomicrospira sp. TaxID=935 RepID=UPI0019FE3661|nr:alpha/beta hydrolase [Thiomicrospira sp.]MBE0493708.1 alpha/beta hydrolase [Thiomicrospira sp.]
MRQRADQISKLFVRLGLTLTLCTTAIAVKADVITSYFQSDNQSLQYQAQGQHQNVVLLLGGGPGFSSWNLTPIQQHLATNHRVLRMDMRGVGENNQQEPVPDNLIDQWITDIENLRQHEQAAQLILVGHSWGALMAQLYAREHPHRVQRLILLNPVDPDLTAMQNLVERIDNKARQAGLIKQNPDEFESNFDSPSAESVTQHQLTRVLPTYFYDIQQGQAYAKQFGLNDFNMAINHAGWLAYQTQPIQAEFLQTLAQDRAISLITCQQDLLMPESLQAYQSILPKLHTQVLQKCAHFPWEEQPKLFYDALDLALTREAEVDDYSDLSPQERAWLLDDSELNELVSALDSMIIETRFTPPFDLAEHYYMTNQIDLNNQSLSTGWAKLTQCHYNLDPVARLQIVYHPEHTKNLIILEDHAIDVSWVEGKSIQMNGLQKGAKICVQADTYALTPQTNGYKIERGPFMRKFLDGYYPLHVELQINWAGLPLEVSEIFPTPQTGVEVAFNGQSLRLGYWFRGELRPQVHFTPKP